MKKKHIVITLLCGLLALVIGVLVIFSVTPASYKIHYDRFTKMISPYVSSADDSSSVPYSEIDWCYLAKNCGKSMNRVYKINPSTDNLLKCTKVYTSQYYILSKQYNKEIPDDYTSYCAKYWEILYNTPYSEVNEPINIVSGPVDSLTAWKLGNGLEYARSLYIDGQVDKSKAVLEELIELIDKEGIFAGEFKDYLYYVNATTDDESLKAWVLEKESVLEEYYRQRDGSFYETHDSYFSNPDLETYYSRDWEEYRESD